MSPKIFLYILKAFLMVYVVATWLWLFLIRRSGWGEELFALKPKRKSKKPTQARADSSLPQQKVAIADIQDGVHACPFEFHGRL